MKTRLSATAATAAAAAAVAVTLSPAIAHADPVDDALNRLPAGQISCEQAEAYWTTEAEYDEIRSQAQFGAAFHPRGGEINDALNRVEEAANRCGLKNSGAPAPAPPAEAINVGVAPGTPYITVPAGPVAVVVPDVIAIIQQAMAQIAGQFNVALPSLPGLPAAGSSF